MPKDRGMVRGVRQVDLFDDILLLREGATVYHGPRESLVQYLQGIGFFPPSHTGGARPPA